MTTPTSTRERRDWTLLIFIIPIGIILMLIAGQVAIHLVPIWSIDAGMKSNLDPNNLPNQESGLVQPVLPAILTPLGWFDTFLTPSIDIGDDIVFPPFVIFEPTIVTPVITPTTPPPTAVTPSPTTIPVTVSPTVIVTTSPTRTQNPQTSTPRPTATPPPTATPTSVPVTSTLPPYIPLPPTIPIDIGPSATPDGTISEFPLPLGGYTTVDITTNPIIVSNAPDGNYDLIFYESTTPGSNPTTILMDQISIFISQDGTTYYQVFNWGDNVPDTNTNLDPTLPETDNASIPTTDLYSPDPSNPTIPQTGILIDVDTAPSNPPEGTYNYLVIVSPPSLDSAQVDAIAITEVPISTTAPAPVAPANNVSDPPADESPSSPVDDAPDPPADESPSSPVDDAPDPPADGPPALP